MQRAEHDIPGLAPNIPAVSIPHAYAWALRRAVFHIVRSIQWGDITIRAPLRMKGPLSRHIWAPGHREFFEHSVAPEFAATVTHNHHRLGDAGGRWGFPDFSPRPLRQHARLNREHIIHASMQRRSEYSIRRIDEL